MRNVIATCVQTVALVLAGVGLWVVSPLLAVGLVLLGVGWYISPERSQ
jgi:hypothetical protein